MVSVGIDVSKGKSMICALRPYGEIVFSPYETTHIESDVAKLISKLKALGDETRVVLESTGAYHLPILLSFKEAGLFVSVINPLVMKKYANTSIRKGKTDKLDAVRIANYGIDNWFKLENYKPDAENYEELKLLGRQYAHYMKLKVESKQSLTNILDRVMPGIKSLIKSVRTDSSEKDKLCDFIEHYWHYDNIICMSETKFTASYNKWAKKVGYRQSASKAIEIYKQALGGVTTLSSKAASTKMLTLEACRVLKEINKTLSIILAQMGEIASVLPEYDVVRKMNGVGDVLAVRLIAEIGDIRRFHNGSSLVAYAGIDAPPYESGAFKGTNRKISKRGSSLLRKTGYEIMRCLKTSKPKEDAAVYQFILKKESEGKNKRLAKIAGLNKFLRIYYARVKEVYNCNGYELTEQDIYEQNRKIAING